VIGFDDIPPSARPNYQLTTIRQPFGRLVDSTIDALLEAINSPDTKVIEKVVPPTLTWRKTVQKNN
jgi:DNA-binding LacI/PurR family transcriptional regulator